MKSIRRQGTEAKRIVRLALATVFVFVLYCKTQVFEVSSSNAWVDFFGNLSNSFQSPNLTDILVWFASYYMIRYVATHDKRIDTWSAILAVVFAVSYVLSSSYAVFNGPAFLTENWYQYFLAGFCLLGYSAFFYVCLRTVLIFAAEHVSTFVRRTMAQRIDRHLLLISFLIILAGWIPWILMNYPGTFCYDALWQLSQVIESDTTAMTTHHPPLSSYIMGSLMAIGGYFADMNFGAFLYEVLQTCVGAWVFAVGVAKVHAGGLRARYCLLFVLFYAVSPVWGEFAQWYEKDLLYAEIATLFLILLIDIIVRKECTAKEALALAGTGILASLLRNNGIYAVVPAIFLLGFYVVKHARRRVWMSLCATLLVYIGIVRLLYPYALGIEQGSIRDALSLPFQQTARYAVEYGDEITEAERKAIDDVLDFSSLGERYSPMKADPVKDTFKEDLSKLPAYFKTWASMFWKHPGSYVSALLNGAYGYLAPVQADHREPELWTEDVYSRWSFLQRHDIHRIFGEVPTSISISIRTVGLYAPLLKYLTMPGTYTWIVAVCAMVLLKKRQYGALIMLVPEFVNILVCIASPLWNAIRYELPVVAAVPLLVGWTFLMTHIHTCRDTPGEGDNLPPEEAPTTA